jgi:hypothetical protein
VSGSTVGSIVGGGIGYLIGGPAGAKWGFMIGGTLGGIVDPVKIKGPRLSDGQTVTSQEGIPIPFGFGTFPVGGNIIWADELVEHQQKEGGKGGPQTTTYTYTRSYAVGICEGEITAVVKAWRNGKLVYDITPTSTITGENTKFLANHTFYTGSETQNVDPTIEAAVGVGNSPPMRGLCYMVAEDEDLTDSGGAVAQWRFVVQDCGTISDLTGNEIRFIVSGLVNEVETTGDGNTWTSRTSGLLGVGLRFMAGNGTNIVASSASGALYYSDDSGVSWATSDSTARVISGIAYGNGRFVAATEEDFVLISLDAGRSWDEYPTGFVNLGAAKIAFGNGNFVIAAASSGGSGGGLHYSTQGTSWSFASAVNAFALAFNGDFFMAVVTTQSYTSASGTSWTAGSAGPGGGSFGFLVLTGQPGYFLAAANNGYGIYRTADLGMNWTSVGLPAGGNAASSPGIDIFPGVTHTRVSTDGGLTFFNGGVVSGTTDVLGIGPSSDWYVVPDGENVYADEDGNLITTFVSGQQVSACTAYLDDIVAALCDRAGIDPTEYDVTDLAGIEVKGYGCATESSAQGFIEPLTNAFFFDKGEWDKKIRFILRGGASVASLDPDDLLAMDGPAIVQTRVQEVELLRRVNVMTVDPEAEFNATKQTAERRIGTIQATGESTVEIPIITDRDTAAGIADKRLKVAWAETDKFSFGTTLAHAELTPTDVVTLTDKAGVAHRIRLTAQAEESGAITTEEAMKDRASTYTTTAAGVQNPNLPGDNDGQFVGPTLFAAMALPMLRSQDDTPGLYVGMTGILPGWPGAQLLMSSDGGLSYTVVLTVTEPTIMGELTADEDSAGDPLHVRVFGGTLESKTTAQVDVGANWSGIETAGVAEIVAYETATPTGEKTYDLTDVTRALDETDYASHYAGDPFMDLSTAYFLPIPQGLAGTTLYFKAVGFGVSADAIDPVAVAWAGVEYVEDGGLIS